LKLFQLVPKCTDHRHMIPDMNVQESLTKDFYRLLCVYQEGLRAQKGSRTVVGFDSRKHPNLAFVDHIPSQDDTVVQSSGISACSILVVSSYYQYPHPPSRFAVHIPDSKPCATVLHRSATLTRSCLNTHTATPLPTLVTLSTHGRSTSISRPARPSSTLNIADRPHPLSIPRLIPLTATIHHAPIIPGQS
jgi:hypothetical protein